MTTITKEQFEDVMFNPDLVVVQKVHSSNQYHVTVLYVYDKVSPEGKITEAHFREVSSVGTEYWMEKL
ncbi:modifier of supressor tRNAs [Serratia phage 92A1]|nr:modifier of supressor tRNAs [Serratia phage 92A1]